MCETHHDINEGKQLGVSGEITTMMELMKGKEREIMLTMGDITFSKTLWVIHHKII